MEKLLLLKVSEAGCKKNRSLHVSDIILGSRVFCDISAAFKCSHPKICHLYCTQTAYLNIWFCVSWYFISFRKLALLLMLLFDSGVYIYDLELLINSNIQHSGINVSCAMVPMIWSIELLNRNESKWVFQFPSLHWAVLVFIKSALSGEGTCSFMLWGSASTFNLFLQLYSKLIFAYKMSL